MTESARDPDRQDRHTEAACPSLGVARCCVTREHDRERVAMSERNSAMSAAMFAGCCRELRFASHARWASHAQWDWNIGWPSLTKPAAAAAAVQHEDRGWLARRIEGRCRSDVFPMALGWTTWRDYTNNGAALPFRPGGT